MTNFQLSIRINGKKSWGGGDGGGVVPRIDCVLKGVCLLAESWVLGA